jgi:hypothetical protein
LDAASVGLDRAKANSKLSIGHERAEPIVGLDERALSGGHVDAVDLEESRVLLIVGEQDLAGKVAGRLLHMGPHARAGREGDDVAGLHVDAERLPILIATVFTKEHQVTVVVRPRVIEEDAAVGHVGHRSCGRCRTEVGEVTNRRTGRAPA